MARAVSPGFFMARSMTPAPFDRLRRDTIHGGYAKTLEHKRHLVEVRLHAESREELEKILPAATLFWKSRVRWFKAFREYAATELLDELNAALDWGQENPPVATSAQVRKVLPAPFSVQFFADDDGTITFEMDGGEDRKILKENCFEVFGTLEEGITEGDVVTLL